VVTGHGLLDRQTGRTGAVASGWGRGTMAAQFYLYFVAEPKSCNRKSVCVILVLWAQL